MSKKRKLYKIRYSQNGTDFIMGCPICDFEYNHIENIETQESDDYSTEFGDIFRGSATIMTMTCEEGHDYRIVFGNHKGWLYLFAIEGHK